MSQSTSNFSAPLRNDESGMNDNLTKREAEISISHFRDVKVAIYWLRSHDRKFISFQISEAASSSVSAIEIPSFQSDSWSFCHFIAFLLLCLKPYGKFLNSGDFLLIFPLFLFCVALSFLLFLYWKWFL